MLKVFKNKSFWIVLIILIIILTSINATSSERDDLTIVEKIIRASYTPLQSGVNEFTDYLNSYSYIFVEKKQLIAEINKLQDELALLKLENQSFREIEAEVIRLRQLVNFVDNNRDHYDFIPARVIARSPNNWYKYIIIDKGKNHGLERNMAVINADGLVGRVINVSDNNAEVFLITDREIAVGAMLQETRETNGIVEGMSNNTYLKMVNIPYYSNIETSNRVITSGLSSIYPKGILIGFVDEVTIEPNGLLLTATIIPAVNFDKLEEVLVISGYRPLVEEEENAEE